MRALPALLAVSLATVPAACARQPVPGDGVAVAAPAEPGGSGPGPILIVAALVTVVVLGVAISSARSVDPFDDLPR